jgi:hypothetical protein
MYSEAFNVLNGVVAKNMDVENPNSMYNSLHNSDMFQQVDSIRSQMGGGTGLPYFFSTGSDSQGSQNTTGLSIITNPENLFDGQTNTQAEVSLISPNNTWSILVLDVSTNYFSATLSSSGTVFMGVANDILLQQGNYVVEESEFTTFKKAGYFSDLSGQVLLRDNTVLRNADLLINQSLLMKYQIVGSTNVLSIGTKYARLRNFPLLEIPEKIIFAVKNGSLNIVKNTPILSIQNENVVDVDGTNLSVNVGLGAISLNGWKAFTTSGSAVYSYGIAESSLYPGITLSDQPSGLDPGFISTTSGGYTQIGNGTISTFTGFFVKLNLNIMGYRARYLTQFSQSGEFIVGSSQKNYQYGIFKQSSTSYTPNGTYVGFIRVMSGLITLTFYNYDPMGYTPPIDNTQYSLIYNASPRFTLFKTQGSNTAHYFSAVPIFIGTHSFYFTLNRNPNENVFIGIVDSSSDQTVSLSGTPVTVMHMSVNASGNIFGNGNNIGSSPEPDGLNYGGRLIYFSYTGNGTNATLRMGTTQTDSIQFIATIANGYRVVIWTVGGSSSTSELMTSIHRTSGNILL